MPFFRRDPDAFARRLVWHAQRARGLSPEQRAAVIEAARDPKFVERLIKRTEAKYGAAGGPWLDWFKGLPWLQIISIALSLLMLI